MKSNFQSNFLKYDGTVHCLNLETLNSKSLALLLSLRPSAGVFACKMEVWLQLNTKNIRIRKHMLRSNIMSWYSGLKGMLPFKK